MSKSNIAATESISRRKEFASPPRYMHEVDPSYFEPTISKQATSYQKRRGLKIIVRFEAIRERKRNDWQPLKLELEIANTLTHLFETVSFVRKHAGAAVGGIESCR